MSSNPPPVDLGEPIAIIECDRYCAGCGYNMRNQHVHRHPQLGVLLCRCPECGRVHSAGDGTSVSSQWLRRLTTVGTVAWMMAVVALCVALFGAQFGLTIGTLEELTRRAPMDNARKVWVRVVREPRDVELFLTVMRSLSFVAGGMLMGLLVTACHHWRRWAYYLVAVLVPATIATIVALIWRIESPHLVLWANGLIAIAALCHLAGGVLGVAAGRGVARLAVRTVLSARLRPVMSFLWTADRLDPPAARR